MSVTPSPSPSPADDARVPVIPTQLPPDASVGELVTEIDRARHAAARTVTALAAKLDAKERIRQKTHEQVQALRWDGRRMAADLRAAGDRMLHALPPPAADGVQTGWHAVTEIGRKVPAPVPIVIGLVLLLRWRAHRRSVRRNI